MSWFLLGIATYFVSQSPSDFGGFGADLAPGDFNGDGALDVAIGGANKVEVWMNGTLSPMGAQQLGSGVVSPGSGFGRALAAGDLNGDGYEDLAVGAYRHHYGGLNAGAAWVYLGGPDGLSDTPDHTILSPSPVENGWFAHSLDIVGDVDGDGLDDLVIGAFQEATEGKVWLYLGDANGPVLSGELAIPAAAPNHMGRVVAGAGDVNDDGLADVVVGGPQAALVYLGHADLAAMGASGQLMAAFDVPPFGSNYFGESVAGAGDLNQDGYDDVVIGAPRDHQMGSMSGAIYVYPGGPGGLDISAQDKRHAFDAQSGLGYGSAVGAAGDVDGDGIDDLIIGAYGGYYGAAYVQTAVSADRVHPVDVQAWTAEGIGTNFGSAVASGDWDGDGKSDVFVSATMGTLPGMGAYGGVVTVFTELFCAQTSTFWPDEDNDDLGDPNDPVVSCVQHPLYVDNADDCDDTDPAVGAALTWTVDADGDNFGAAGGATLEACEQPAGYAGLDWDCNDNDGSIHPFANDPVGDGVDADCNGEDGQEISLNCAVVDPRGGGALLALLGGVLFMRRRSLR